MNFKSIFLLLFVCLTAFFIQSSCVNKPVSDKERLTGQFNYKTDPDFIKLPLAYSTKEIYLRKTVFEKFKAMADSAAKAGVTLKALSGTRSYSEQKNIWDNKWNNYFKNGDSIACMKKILLYSSMPSTSRHHWGTDIDINSLEPSYFATGKGLKEYTWLVNNAHKFGFCQVYDDMKKTGRTGYQEEKWHWSYLPESTKFLNEYHAKISYADIKGFKGSNLASKINFIPSFVDGISKKCK
jgi:LAS superfamily LD-carboxypeptidase LdcB